MNDRTLFSIIIPVYNVAPYLRECLDSVLAQTFSDWEAICVDDGSTDGSGAILDEYASKDSRFRVLRQPNRGVSAARNAALDVATGEWFGFVDADDLVSEDWLEVADTAASKNDDVDLIRFNEWRFDECKIYKRKSEAFNCQVVNASDHLGRDLVESGIWSNFYRRSRFASERFALGVANGEDILFLSSCLRKVRKIARIQSALYGYRQRAGSASHSTYTFKYAKDETGCRRQQLLWLLEDARSVERSSIRWLILFLTEATSYSCFLLPVAFRGAFVRFWFDELRTLRPYLHKLPRWNAIVVWLLTTTNSFAVAWVLCYVPHWLKKHGIHR